MKKILISTLFSAACAIAGAQTQQATHIVQRGETLESIAEYYHVSVDDINKANPNAEGIIYVGMKLVVPQAAATTSTQAATTKQGKADAAAVKTKSAAVKAAQGGSTMASERNTQAHSTKEYVNRRIRFKVFAGATAGQWTGKDFNGDGVDEGNENGNVKNKAAFGFHIGANADYMFDKNFYAGAGLMFNRTGYKKDVSISSGKYWDDEGANYEGEETITMSTNKLELPIHVGGTFYIGSNSNLFIEAGPVLSYALSGSRKTKGYTTIHEDIHSGETERIDEKVSIGDGALKDYQKFGYGIAATAGFSNNGISLQLTYQRGLSKTIKYTKQYEQNFLLSIGYTF